MKIGRIRAGLRGEGEGAGRGEGGRRGVVSEVVSIVVSIVRVVGFGRDGGRGGLCCVVLCWLQDEAKLAPTVSALLTCCLPIWPLHY